MKNAGVFKITQHMNFKQITKNSKKLLSSYNLSFMNNFFIFIILCFFQTSPIFGSDDLKEDSLIPIDFKIEKIYESEFSTIYTVRDLKGHLSPLGIESAVHSLVEIKKNGIFVIDPGPHPRYAKKILSSVQKVHGKKLPNVKWVFNSTGKPENVLGNSAFDWMQPVYMSSRVTLEVMRSKCEQCRKDLFSVVPEKGLMDEKIVYPNYIVEDHQILHPQLRDWKTYTFSCAKNTGDTALWNKKAGILYAGRMVHSGNLPSLLHANTYEWIKSLKTLENLSPKYVVGSGNIGSSSLFSKSDIQITKNYLSDLLLLVKNDFNAGGNGSDADKRLGLPKFKNLLGYSDRHGLNVQHVWREFEIAQFGDEVKCSEDSLKGATFEALDSNKMNKRLSNKSDYYASEIAKNSFVFTGFIDDFTKENLGHISNYGFIIGEQCVAIIDTGGSKNTGLRLLRKIRKTTTKPICYVINTHAHPDHIGGNQVFRNLNPKPEFISHYKFEAALSSRFQTFNKRLYELMGLKNVVILGPVSKEVKKDLEIDLGGRKLFLKAWKTSHTDNDLTVFDDYNRVLWTGDLLFVDHIPVLDGNLSSWIKTTRELTKSRNAGSNGLQVKFIVPGHGKFQKIDSEKLHEQNEYLVNLYNLTKQALKEGKTISDAVESVSHEIKEGWDLPELFNKRNVTSAYAELEWE